MGLASCALLGLVIALTTEGGSQPQKNVFWTVSLDTPQQIIISAGDMLRVKSPAYAVVPANLQKTFQITYDLSRFSLIAEKPPESDGKMGKQYFLLATAPGASQITVTVKDRGKVFTTATLSVTSR